MNNIILISKDALRCSALPVYGNQYWKTPNISELAAKGTVFLRHYTAGGSTAMAFTSLALGKYCFQTDRKLYDGSESCENGHTLFDKLHDRGYDVHIAWDSTYTSFAQAHFKCEGEHTTVHSLKRIIPQHSAHIKGRFDDLTYKDEETTAGLKLIEELFDSLKDFSRPVFLWLHLPHVFAGRNAYDSDIDIFDDIVGMARNSFGDECIYVSADHGQMNGHKERFSYGYNVEENVMRVPLITPKFLDMDTVDFPTTHIQLDEIFGLESFNKREFVMCETAYYAQPKRRLAIIHDNYKLVYDKAKKQFSLFDLEWDEREELNLYYPEFYDQDRFCWYSLNQRFFYPYWDKAFKEKELLQKEFNEVWKNGTLMEEFTQELIHWAKLIISRIQMKKKKNKITNIGK